MRGFKRASAGVFVASGPMAAVGARELALLKKEAAASPRGRARLCAHRTPRAPVHEMIIALSRKGYIRPHRHTAKVESYHVIEGSAAIVSFDRKGRVAAARRLGPRDSGRTFYFRAQDAAYHTFVLFSGLFVFQETTNGPFDPSETLYAPWSPEERDAGGSRRYQRRLRSEVKRFLEAHEKDA